MADEMARPVTEPPRGDPPSGSLRADATPEPVIDEATLRKAEAFVEAEEGATNRFRARGACSSPLPRSR